jgi:hypothetical protein
MGKKVPLAEVDPQLLPLGLRVGSWRVTGWRGRGVYGAVYRVEWEGREELGPFAMKLAVYPRDERFQREAWLLSHIHSPHVPRLYAQGVWEHPYGAFPYLVMQWIDGEPLYEWAARRNPTERQVLGVLAHVAHALVAAHAVGGVHRDVKGDNVLVRPRDGWTFLTDFGAGHYRGAATLTSKLLPPGTPAYRSPEAWAFLRAFLRHPTAHYPASACDDLFALGMMGWRLVTDEYPPSTDPKEPGAEVWREGGPGLPGPRARNPRVSPELEAVLLKLLAVAPEERFQGKAQGAVEALEQARESKGSEAEVPLFDWGHERRPRVRSPGGVRWVKERDVVAREEWARREREGHARTAAESRQAPLLIRVRVWGVEGVAAAVGLVLAWLLVAALYRVPERATADAASGAQESESVAVGDSVSAASLSTHTLAPTDHTRSTVGRSLPEEPLTGQRKPPCNRTGEVEIRGGCWFELTRVPPPCKEEGKDEAYAWKGTCYTPSYPIGRQPTSDLP